MDRSALIAAPGSSPSLRCTSSSTRSTACARNADAAVAAVILWLVNGTFPTYFAFLVGGAVLPAMFLYRSIGGLTNWPAFAVTTLYVILSSVIWEATLAIPRLWWASLENTGC